MTTTTRRYGPAKRAKAQPKARTRATKSMKVTSSPEPRSRLLKLYTLARRQRLGLPPGRTGQRLPPGMIRLDYPSARGYLIRIGYTRTRQGYKPQNKAYFSDARYGTPAKARAAAEAWLERLLRTGRAPRHDSGRTKPRAA